MHLTQGVIEPSQQRLPTTPTAQPHTQQPPSGVLCTLLHNEAKYLQEWIAFHLLVGAKTIVIYDDSSTDNLKQVVAPFQGSVVLHHLGEMQGVPGDATTEHRQRPRQGEVWAFNTEMSLCTT